MLPDVPRAKGHNTLVAFVIVGGLTALLYFGLLTLFLEVLGFGYRVAVGIGYPLAITFHFLLNRHLTFRSVEGSAAQQAGRYLIVAGINYLLTLSVVFLAIEIAHVNAYLAVALSIFVTVGFSYIASKGWVFKVSQRRHG